MSSECGVELGTGRQLWVGRELSAGHQKSAGDGFFVPGKREEEALGCGSLFCVCTSIMNTREQENALSQQVS